MYSSIKIMLIQETLIMFPLFSLKNESLNFVSKILVPVVQTSTNQLVEGRLKQEVGPELFSEEWVWRRGLQSVWSGTGLWG